jgi:hypothetical protein
LFGLVMLPFSFRSAAVEGGGALEQEVVEKNVAAKGRKDRASVVLVPRLVVVCAQEDKQWQNMYLV